ncbi:hypothetical protein D3C72_2267560 [compost metagenome]
MFQGNVADDAGILGDERFRVQVGCKVVILVDRHLKASSSRVVCFQHARRTQLGNVRVAVTQFTHHLAGVLTNPRDRPPWLQALAVQ